MRTSGIRSSAVWSSARPYRMLAWATVGALMLGALGEEAAAWGPNGRRTVALTALQLLRRTYPDAFRAEAANYESDLQAGAQVGVRAVGAESAAESVEQAVAYVTNEMALLREVRKFGVGSYFSFRMGVLASVTSDLLMPFAFDRSPEARRLKGQVEANIDARLAKFSFRPRAQTLQTLRYPGPYFAQKRLHLAEAEGMIKADYAGPNGYDGYLRKGGEAFFGEAVRAVADVWHTVFQPKPDAAEAKPSADAMTWYFVHEIEYLLMEKGNRFEARKAYSRFAAVNPDIMKAYEQVGDCFYQSGDKERGVQEWRLALRASGQDRQRVVKKLAMHYLDVGKSLLASAAGPEAPERALEDAMTAFTQALQIDTTSDEAARLLSEASVQLAEKQQQLNLTLGILSSGDAVMAQAAKSEKDGAYSDAIALLQRAQKVYGSVTNAFPAQAEIAKTKTREAGTRLDTVINSVLNQAGKAVDEAEQLMGENRFDDAAQKLTTVEGIVAIVPEEDYGERKQEVIQRAKTMTEDVQRERVRWEEEQRRQQELAAQRAAQG